MSSNKTTVIKTTVDDVIDNVYTELMSETPGTERFNELTNQLEKLYKVRVLTKDDDKVNLKDLLPMIGNLLGILSILNFERAGVVTSKALGFVTKSKS